MTDAYVIHYLNIILGAVSGRHPWLMSDGFPTRFMIRVCRERLEVLLKGTIILTSDFDPGGCFMMALEDVLSALGRPERTYNSEGGFVVRRDDMLALDKVWLSEDMRWAEIAEEALRD